MSTTSLRRCVLRGLTAAIVVSAVLLSVPVQASPIVYNQPPQSPVISTRASQNQSGAGLVFQTYDNFSVAQDLFIDGVSWQGSYFNTTSTDPAFEPPANATGFSVNVYGDSAGAPGTLLSSYSFSPAGAGETFVGQQAFSATLGLSIYNYSAALSGPFFATAGTQYWLSIYAFTPVPSADEAQWGWNGGAPGNGSSLQSTSGGTPVFANNDRAFTLTGTSEVTPVPEPSTWLLLGSGVVALVARSRVRRRTGR